jgi:hypothetical protein
MQAITKQDVDNAFQRYVQICTENNLTTPDREIQLTHGSKTNGIAFRVYTVGRDRTLPGWSGHSRPPAGDDFLGMTKAEAYATLQERNRTIADVLDALNR